MSNYTTHVYDENAELRKRIAELEAQVEKGRNIVRNDMHRAGQYQARIDALEAALREARDTIDTLPGYPKGADICDRIDKILKD